ncbi:MAG: hypothetical protein NC453_11510 [Muribaculum sp.]|nr:hypothetical protein [Muribaculum sp.]
MDFEHINELILDRDFSAYEMLTEEQKVAIRETWTMSMWFKYCFYLEECEAEAKLSY